jgi:hypothetical protein
MPNVYANVTELLAVGELKDRESVMIGKVQSRVCSSWLHTGNMPNAYVIDNLGLDKVKLAAASYGYEPLSNGAFPDSKDRDYPALTRFAAVLMALTELKDVNTERKTKERDIRNAKKAELALLKIKLHGVDLSILQLEGAF